MRKTMVPREVFCAVMVAGVLGCGLDLVGEGLVATGDAGLEETHSGQISDSTPTGALGDDAGSGSNGRNANHVDAGSLGDATADGADARSSRGTDSSAPLGLGDGGSQDGADDGGGVCDRLTACCHKLGALGGNAQSCLQSAQGRDAGTCQSALFAIQLGIPGLCP